MLNKVGSIHAKYSGCNFFPSKTLGALAVILLSLLRSHAVDNVWTNATSGYWENPNWSLGILPGPGQNIYFTNSGWKALAIGADTVQNNSQTLTVQDIVVSSPGTDTVNTLLFNYFGLGTPLRANSLSLGTNCNLDMYYCALNVTNALLLDGIVTQDVASVVTSGHLSLGVNGPARYTLADGSLAPDGEDIGLNCPSTFIQTGGSNGAWILKIYSNSVYTQIDGTLAAIVVVRGGGSFTMSGGLMNLPGALLGIDGSFEQTGGVIDARAWMGAPDPFYGFHVPGNSGTIVQSGGTNRPNDLVIGQPDLAEGGDYESVPVDHGGYTLSDGVLATSTTEILGNGSFEQSGGTHSVSGPLTNQGSIYYSYRGTLNRFRPASYSLSGGNVAEASLFVGIAGTFTQSGGTNNVAGDITIACPQNPSGSSFHGRYILNGGVLTVSNVVASGGYASVVPGEFTQTGGQLVVSNDLSLSWTTFEQTDGSVNHMGRLVLSNASLSLSGGNQQLGRLEIHGVSSSPCGLTLPSSACAIHLHDSSSLGWSTAAILNITNWAGSLYGGGMQQLVFGNTSSALTPAQLAQITFVKPAHLPPANYPTRILASGEIVPDSGSALPLLVSLSASSNGTVQLGLGGEISNKYEIDISSNLVNWTPWRTQTDLSGMIYLSNSAADVPQRFYRAMLIH
jgi:hypothetical protein